ncbi:MAG: VCBS repeat-containing protein [Elusimicrobia bacterium]|nr:VCBS repeat-containing protein [Elusimicrobiota bacterium]
MKAPWLRSLLAAALWLGCASASWAAAVSWDDGGGDGNWYTSANWSGDVNPGVADDVTIDAAVTVTASASSPTVRVNSLSIGGTSAPAVFIDTSAVITAALTISSGGTLNQGTTHQFLAASALLASGAVLRSRSNSTVRQYLVNIAVSGDFDVAAGATVSVQGRGYSGGTSGSCPGGTAGLGSGGGGAATDAAHAGGAGAGHGGAGGAGGDGAAPTGGGAYETAAAPSDLGSGGGGGSSCSAGFNGGDGGGAVFLSVGGRLTLDGYVTANGSAGTDGNGAGTDQGAGGGGSGGTVVLTAATARGAGTIHGRGGKGGDDANLGDDPGGGGGGGRVVVAVSGYNGSTWTYSVTAGAAGAGGAALAGADGTAFPQPGAITDLAASVVSTGLGASSQTVTLTWTAPAPGIAGASNNYDIRWATFPISSMASYNIAPYASVRSTSLAAGVRQSTAIANLDPRTTWYFAITISDLQSLRSDISNAATAQAYVIGLLGTGGDTRGAAWGDYDNDGDLDALLANDGVQDEVILRNDGGGVLTKLTLAGTAGDSWGVAWADYDNDGDLDALVANGGTEDEVILRNDGGGVMTKVTLTGTGGFSIGVAWGDYDNDGDLDALVANTFGEDEVLLRNDGGGVLTKVTLTGTGGDSNGVAWGDYDNDGDLDALVANTTGQDEYLLRNDGGGVLTKVTLTGTGGNSRGVAWGDYDNDGDLDAIVANDVDQDEVLLRNDGGGVLTKVTLTGTGGYSEGVAWGDFDNDGDLDALVGNTSGQDEVLLRNDGGGVLTKVTLTGTGGDTHGVSWGDYDDDGDLDALLANVSAGNEAVLRNDVSVGHSSPSAPSAGFSASFAEYSASSSSGVLSLLWGDGSDAETPAAALRYFARVGTTTAGSSTTYKVPPRYSLDGYSGGGSFLYSTKLSASQRGLKLVMQKEATAYWAVVTEDGESLRSAESAAQETRLSAPRRVTDLAVSIVSTGLGASSMTVTLSWTAPGDDGDSGAIMGGAFDIRYSTLAPMTSTGAYAGAPAVFSVLVATSVAPGARQSYSIGLLDARTTHYFALTTKDGVGVRSGLSNPATAQAYANSLTGTGGSSVGVAWADYDNDGDLDALIANAAGADEVLLRNDGGGVLTKVTLTGTGGDSTGVAWGDFDNDGDLDAIIANASGQDEVLLRNDGGGTFTKVTLTGTGGDSYGVAVGDYDNDGDLDILVANYSGQDEVLLRNDGGGTFTKVTLTGTGGTSVGVAWGDYDNDGDLDAIVSNAAGQDEYVLRNDGGGVLSSMTLTGTGGNSSGVAWGDYDNDGDLDALVANYGSDEVLLRNDGGGTLTTVTLTGTGGDSGSVAWGDYDNDGDLDALVGNSSGQDEVLLRNDGGGVLTKVTLAGSAGGSQGVSWGDYDEDGDLDALVANYGPADEVLLRNDVSVSHSSPAAPASGFSASFSEYSLSSSSGLLYLRWGDASDAETPAAALRYFVRVGTGTAGSSTVQKIPARYSLDGYSGGGSFLYSTKLSDSQRGLKLVMSKGATVHWAVVTEDGESLRSGESAAQVANIVPPSAVVLSAAQDSTVETSSTAWIALTFNAPGEDAGVGDLAAGAVYDVRWSSAGALDTLARYAAAPYAQALSAVGTAGAPVTLRVSVEPGKTWYFALTTKDSVGSRSALSNSPNAYARVVVGRVDDVSLTTTLQGGTTAFLKLRLWTEGTGATADLLKLSVRKTGTLPDAALSNVGLYLDDGDGAFTASDELSLLTSPASFVSSAVTLSLAAPDTLQNSTRTYFVGATVRPDFLPVEGASIALHLDGEAVRVRGAGVEQTDLPALAFDGVDDRVTAPYAAALDLGGIGQFTLEAWLRSTDTARANMAVITRGNAGGDAGYRLWLGAGGCSAGVPSFFVGSSVLCADNGSGQVSVTDGRWHHVAAVFDAGVGRLFVDGVPMNSGAMGGTLADGASDLAVGGPNGSGVASYFIGELDEARLTAFVRYPAELPPLRRNTASGALVLYHFDAPVVANRAVDSSISGIDGTLQGGAAGYARSTGTALTDARDTLFADAAPLLPPALFRNDQNVAVMRLRLWTGGDFITLDQLSVAATGTAAASSVSQLKLYRDDGDGLFNAGSDTALTLGQSFLLGKATFSLSGAGTSQTLSPSTRTFFLAWNVSVSAQTGADIGVVLVSSAEFVLSGATDTVSASVFPLASGTAPIVAAQALVSADTSSGTWLNVSSVVFRAAFGSGNIDHLHWRWDQSPASAVDGGELPAWSSGKTTVTAASDNSNWYFHARAFDTFDDPGLQTDLGPFWLDRTVPVGGSYLSLNSTGGAVAETQFGDLAAGVTVQLVVSDAVSGLNVDGPAPYAPSSGAVSLWHLDETSGNWADSGPAGNALSASGTPGRGPGRFGAGLLLDAASFAQRAAPAGLPVGNAARTLEAWINTVSTSGTQAAVSWSDGACGSATRLGLLGGRLWADLGCASTPTSAAVSTGVWHHVALTYDGSVGRFYLDGVRVASQTYGAQASAAGTLTIGNNEAGQGFRGAIDEARVSARAFSDAEIAASALRGDPYYVSFSSDAGASWVVINSTVPALGPYAALTGAHGATGNQTLSASGLSLAVSTSAQTGGSATNQARFHFADVAGNVRTMGPFAVLVDTNASVAFSTPSLPAPGSYTGTRPDFYWTGPSTSVVQGMGGQFFVQVSSADPAFAAPSLVISVATPAAVTDPAFVRVTGVYLSTFTLTGGTTYYWRVRSRSSLGVDGAWGPVGGFVVDTSSPTVSSFLVYNSTGGAFSETGPIDLRQGVTVQVTAADTVSGLGAANALTVGPGTAASWRFSERHGAAPLDEAAGAVGVLVGGRYGLTPFGAGLALSGAGQYMSAPNTAFQFAPASTFTVSAWVRPTASVNQVLAAVGAPLTPGGSNWVVWVNNTGALRLTNATGGGVLSPAGLIQNGVWQHVTVVQQGTKAWFYINGVLRHSQGWSGNSGGGTMAFSVGAGIRNTAVAEAFFNGDLDEVKVFSTASGPDEVAADFARGVPGRFAVEYSTTAGAAWNVVSATFPGAGFPYIAQTGVDGSAGPEVLTVRDLAPAHSTTAAVGSLGTNLLRFLSADRRGNFTLAGPFTLLVDTVAAAAVSTPTLPAPGVFVSTRPDFAWGGPSTTTAAGMGAGALFLLEADDQADFSSPAIAVSTPVVIAGTATAFTQGVYVSTFSLLHGTTYYWRVRARDFLGIYSQPLTVSSFVTDYLAPAGSAFASLNSTGGLVGESIGITLAAGVTVQLTVQDTGPAGLAHAELDDAVPYGVMYTTNGAGLWNDGSWGPTLTDAGATAARSLARYGGALFMGADTGRVWRFDGSVWALSTTLGAQRVLALKAFGGKLYAGLSANGQVWEFNGAAWSLSASFTAPDDVQTLEAYNGRLYAGLSSGRLMQYEPSNGRWELLHVFAAPPGVGVQSLGVYDGRLFAGANPNVYVLDTSTWSLSFTASASILALKAYDGKLFAATNNSGIISQFDGQAWTVSNDPPETESSVLTVHAGRLYAASAEPSNGRLYAYDAKSWVLVRTLPNAADKISALAAFGGRLYAGLEPASGNAEVFVSTPLVTSLSGAEGSAAPQTLSASGLSFEPSLTGTVCAGNPSCTATNQVRFAALDRGGRVGQAGPFAVLVDSLLSQPTAYYPAPARWVRETLPDFAWIEASTMPQHQVQVSTGPDFTALTINQTTAHYLLGATASLANDTTYYWRVKALNAFSVGSAFSPTVNFAVDPAAPSTSAYRHLNSTGGALAESQFTDLAAGSTIEFTVRDPASGLLLEPLGSQARVGAWSFEDSGTSSLDFSGRGHNATLDAAIVRSGSGYRGLGLRGSGTFAVNIASSPATTWTGLTVAGWAKPTRNASALMTLFATVRNQVYAQSAQGRVLYGARATGAGGCALNTAQTYPLGAWQHVAFVADPGANENRLYVDGELAASCSGASSAGDTRLRLLADGVTGIGSIDAYEGFLDEVRLFSAPLSAAAVRREADGAPFAVAFSTDAGASWSAVSSTFGAGPRLAFTGNNGATSDETIQIVGLPLRQSTVTAVCGQVSPCLATNQVQFFAPDRAGSVRTMGPFAVRVDTSVPTPVVLSLAPTATDQIAVISTGTDNTAGSGLRDFLFEASTSQAFAAPLSSSGFIAQTTYTFTGLIDATTYWVRVWSRDQLLNVSTPTVELATATFGTVFLTTQIAAPPSALQGAFVPMLTLRLASKPGSTSRLLSLRARKTGTAPDSSVDQVQLYAEADGDGVFSGGDTQQTAAGLALGEAVLVLAGAGIPLDVAASTFHVVFKMNAGAVTDDTVGLEISSTTSVGLQHPARAQGSFPAVVAPIPVSDGANVLNIIPTSLAPAAMQAGSNDIPVLELRAVTDTGTSIISSVTVTMTGTTPPSKVRSINLWRDADPVDGLFGPGDIRLTSDIDAFGGGNTATMSITGFQVSSRTVTTSARRFFITVSLAADAPQDSVFRLGLASTSAVTLQNLADTVAFSAAVLSSTVSVILNNVLTVAAVDETPAAYVQGERFTILRATMTVDVGAAQVNRVTARLTGNGQGSDIAAVEVWRDATTDGQGLSAVLDTRVGSAPYSGGLAVVDIDTQTILSGTSAVFFLAYVVEPAAAPGVTLGMKLNAGDVRAGNSGTTVAGNLPIESSSRTVQATVNRMVITNAIKDVSPGALLQGQQHAAMLRLDVISDKNDFSWLGLSVERLGTAPDSAVSAVNVFRDFDGNGSFDVAVDSRVTGGADVFSNSTATLTLPQVQTVSASTKTYFVTLSVAAGAESGKTLGVRISTTASFNLIAPNTVSTATAFPIQTGLVPVNQFQNTVTVTTASVVPGVGAEPGAIDVPFMSLALRTDVSNAAFQSLRVDQAGTAADADVKQVKLYYDTNDTGNFDSSNLNNYLLVTSSGQRFGSNGPASVVVSFSTPQVLGTAPKRYFLVLDLSTAAVPARTVVVRASTGAFFTVDAPNRVDPSVNFVSAALNVNAPPTTMFVVGTDSAPATVTQGTPNVPMLTLKVRTAAFTARWNQLRVTRTGTGQDGHVPSVKLYRDADGDGTLDISLDERLSTTVFSGGTALLGFSTQTITVATVTYFVTYDFKTTATAGDTAGARIAAAGDLRVETPDTVSTAGFPLQSTNAAVVATQAGLFVTATNLAPGELKQAATEQVLMSLAVQTTQFALTWSALTVRSTGSAADSDIKAISLWHDANINGVVDVGTDTKITSGLNAFLGGVAVLSFASVQDVGTSQKRYLLTVDPAPFAEPGRTFAVLLQSTASLSVSSPNFVVPAGFPAQSDANATLRKLEEELVVTPADLVVGGVNQGARQALARLSTRASRNRVSWSALVVRQNGNLGAGEIDFVGVWRDVDGDLALGSADLYVGSATFSGSQASVFFSTVQTVGVATQTYFLAVQPNISATVGADIRLSLQTADFTLGSPDTVGAAGLPFNTGAAPVLDAKTPSRPVVTDAGASTSDFEGLDFTWVSSVGSGTLAGAFYAVGTTAGGTDVRGWTAIAAALTTVRATGFALNQATTYYVAVKTQSSFAFDSPVGVSDGILMDFQVPLSPAPSVTTGSGALLVTWANIPGGPSGIIGYLVEYRTGASPQWINAKTGEKTSVKAMTLAAAPGARPAELRVLAVSTDSLVTSNSFQAGGLPAGTLFVRVSAVTGSGVLSSASDPVQVQLGPLPKDGITDASLYPNPFDSRKRAGNIHYALSANAEVSIKVYSVFGRLLREMSFAPGSSGGVAGSNTVAWDGADDSGTKVAKGMYIMVITSGGAKAVLKVGVIH